MGEGMSQLSVVPILCSLIGSAVIYSCFLRDFSPVEIQMLNGRIEMKDMYGDRRQYWKAKPWISLFGEQNKLIAEIWQELPQKPYTEHGMTTLDFRNTFRFPHSTNPSYVPKQIERESHRQAFTRRQNFLKNSHTNDLFWASGIAAKPNDPDFRYQWPLPRIGAPKAWKLIKDMDKQLEREENPVIVCIIDSGIDPNHEDLIGNLHPDVGYDAINESHNITDGLDHGTHIAGIIGAVTNNDLDVAGLGDNLVQVLACKFLNDMGYGYVEDAVQCIEYCIEKKADIISNSYSGPSSYPKLENAIKKAQENDILFIAAAGNTASNLDIEPAYPGAYTKNYTNVIAVASTNYDNGLSNFTNFGYNTVQIAAPGEWILSTTPFNETAYYSGSSMAVPFVAAAAALVMHVADRNVTAIEVKDILLESTEKLASLDGKISSEGLLRVDKAVELAQTKFSSKSNGEDIPSEASKIQVRKLLLVQ